MSLSSSWSRIGGSQPSDLGSNPSGDTKGDKMKEYEQHIHYSVEGLSLKEKGNLLRRAFDVNFNWWVDKLDCSVSWSRQRIEMSFEEIMDHLTDDAYVVVIHRRGYVGEPYLEVGFSSMERPVDYFLWIQVPLSLKDEFIEGLSRK